MLLAMLSNISHEGKTDPKATSVSSGSRSQLSIPTISLPKGGGAIRGIGEKFAANPANTFAAAGGQAAQ